MKTNSMESNISNSGTNQKQCEEQMEKIKREMKLIVEKFIIETSTNNLKHENEIKVSIYISYLNCLCIYL
jgi:hypothetical protein